jgi:hypothetical protein
VTQSVASYRLDELIYDPHKPLGEGGAAEIFRCTTFDGQRRILKQYNDDTIEHVDFDALRRLIAWAAALTEEDQSRLTQLCAWPQAVVISDGTPVGVLMKEAPSRFFLKRNGASEPCHFSRIAVQKSRAEKGGYEYFDFPEKIARLGHLLTGLQFLHSHGIVIGDLQWNNILTTGTGPYDGDHLADVYFVDCDSFIVGGQAALPNMDPLAWKQPWDVKGFSERTDLFKFALAVIRSLSEQTNRDSIVFAQYKELLPSDDLEIIRELLTSQTLSFGAQQLSAMARAWELSVRKDGRMYRRTDEFARGPWSAEARDKHLGGIPATKPEKRDDDATSQDSSYSVPNHQRRWWLVAAGAAAVLIIAMIALAGSREGQTRVTPSPSRTTYVAPTYYSPTYSSPAFSFSSPAFTFPPMTTLPPRPANYHPVYDARVGDCVQLIEGKPKSDGSRSATVNRAACGDPSATNKVLKVTTSVAECEIKWVSYPTPLTVLCLGPA